MSNELAVLRTLRLKGRAGVADIAFATGVGESGVAAVAAGLVESGSAREVGGAYMLLAPGRERQTELLDAERAGVDGTVVDELYHEFTAVNGDFKALAHDWQLRGEEPNDHSDAAYDQEVINRLAPINARVMPIVERAAALVPGSRPTERASRPRSIAFAPASTAGCCGR